AGGWVITFEQRPSPRPLIVQILPVMGGPFVFTWLLLHTRGLSYTGRVVFITIAGLVPTALALIFHPSWWRIPGVYTGFAECAVMWLLAGLVIAKVATVRAAQEQPLMRTP